MNYVFERLSFRQKIIFGFSLLSAVFIFGMGYMLFEFTNISQLSTNIIEKQRPIIRSSSNAREYSQSAANYLHKFILNGNESNLVNYSRSINELKKSLKSLSKYIGKPDFELKEEELQRLNIILKEIDQYVLELKKYKNNYIENHPIINTAANTLNPLAIEYLGIINSIIYENTHSGISRETLVQFADMRHSWTQMLSSLRITLATKQAREFVNVKTYSEINKKQMKMLKELKFDFFQEDIAGLEKIRKEFMKHFDTMIEGFDSTIWSMEAHLMTAKIMPLFDEVDVCLTKLLKVQLKQSEKADVLLSQHLRIAHYSYIALIVISFFIAFLISSFITRSVRRPLIKLVDASNEVAKGNFDTKIKVIGHDEISYLAKTFNDMVSKLQESQMALTTARDVAEHASLAKSEFLTRISHELRTPLNAILGFAQILSIDTSDNVDLSENKYVKNILKSGWHLLDLVEELLDLGQIETNTILLQNEKEDVLRLIEECIEIVRPIANEKNISIFEDIQKDCACYSNVDPVRFKQVVLNLLTNAVKFNKDKGKIKITSDFIGDQFIRISIYDEGAGLTTNQKHEVFDAFQRLDANKKAIEGVGIGLNIAKNLVELMNGNIGVESNVGEGCCFWLEFPILEIIPLSNNNKNKESEYISANDNNKLYHVLYIEDDEFNLELVREILSVMRPEILLFEASTAEDGLKIVKEEKFDLILMDLNLPGMSGQEALNELKKYKNTANIPVVALSADALTDSIKSGKTQGFKDYITKPINIDHFISVLDTILESEEMD